jgi:Tfp pilus assembly protein PilN
LSTGTKRSSSSLSTHSIGTSPSKKSKSSAVKNMNRNMEHLSIVLENRTAMMRQALAQREKEQRDKREATLRKI